MTNPLYIPIFIFYLYLVIGVELFAAGAMEINVSSIRFNTTVLLPLLGTRAIDIDNLVLREMEGPPPQQAEHPQLISQPEAAAEEHNGPVEDVKRVCDIPSEPVFISMTLGNNGGNGNELHQT